MKRRFERPFWYIVPAAWWRNLKSDAKGNFEAMLPAGDYVIFPDESTPMPAPQNQKR
jgi:hypothetical protein